MPEEIEIDTDGLRQAKVWVLSLLAGAGGIVAALIAGLSQRVAARTSLMPISYGLRPR